MLNLERYGFKTLARAPSTEGIVGSRAADLILREFQGITERLKLKCKTKDIWADYGVSHGHWNYYRSIRIGWDHPSYEEYGPLSFEKLKSLADKEETLEVRMVISCYFSRESIKYREPEDTTVERAGRENYVTEYLVLKPEVLNLNDAASVQRMIHLMREAEERLKSLMGEASKWAEKIRQSNAAFSEIDFE